MLVQPLPQLLQRLLAKVPYPQEFPLGHLQHIADRVELGWHETLLSAGGQLKLLYGSLEDGPSCPAAGVAGLPERLRYATPNIHPSYSAAHAGTCHSGPFRMNQPIPAAETRASRWSFVGA